MRIAVSFAVRTVIVNMRLLSSGVEVDLPTLPWRSSLVNHASRAT
jgi:hypothetical protein